MTTSSEKTAVQHLFIPVGTEVSAKFRGAFCEAKVTECDQKLKYKVCIDSTNEMVSVDFNEVEIVKPALIKTFVLPTTVNEHDVFHVDSVVKLKSTKTQGVIKKLIDASLYTVVFDDADQSQFKRKAIKLKGDKYFKNEENMNTMPLVKPESFSSPAVVPQGSTNTTGILSELSSTEGTPVRPAVTRRSRGQKEVQDGSDPILVTFCSTSESESCLDESASATSTASNVDEGESISVAYVKQWIFNHLDEVVWIEKDKGLNFPGLIIDPWETEKKRDADNHVIVRSFRDNRLHSVPFKFVEDFDRNMRSDKPQLQVAIELANAYIVDNVLPKNWMVTYRQIYRDIIEYLQDDTVPQRVVSGQFSIEIGRLFFAIWKLGGFEAATQLKSWASVYKTMSKACANWGSTPSQVFVSKMKSEYKKYLLNYETVFESRLAVNDDNPLPVLSGQESKPTLKVNELEVKTDPVSLDNSNATVDQFSGNLSHAFRSVDDLIHVNFEDGKIYPAKILKIDTSRSFEAGIYYIHYKNWNARHDQWISEDMIADSENLDQSLLSEVKNREYRKSESKTSPQSVKSEDNVVPKLNKIIQSEASFQTPTVTLTNQKGDGNSLVGKVSPQSVTVKEEPMVPVQSSLSRMIAEKRNLLLQSSSDGGLRLPDVTDMKTKSPSLPAGSELPGKRSRKVSSSSDEETAGKIVRTPRKLRRKTNSRSSVSESPQLKELLTNPDYHFNDKSSQKSNERKRFISIAEISTNIEFEESLQEVKPVMRSPPKRRRIVKRSSLSENGKNSSAITPTNLLRSVSQPQPLPTDESADLDVDNDEDVKKQQETAVAQCETNDEGFSADEECESDDTIDMNKLAEPEMEVNNDDEPEQDSSKLNSNTNTLDPGNICDVSPIVPKTESVSDLNNASKPDLIETVICEKCDTGYEESVKEIRIEINEVSKTNVSLDSTDDLVPFSSPAVDNVTSTLKKKEKSDGKIEGTPAGTGLSRKTAKRNGKNGQYKHGFFISDAENSEIDEITQNDSVRGNKQGNTEEHDEELQAYLCSIYNVENELEDLMDVKALDDIVDIDERILVAERQMNLIQKRYKQLYREMEKLDNLKRRIRKKKKSKPNTSQNVPKSNQRGDETVNLELEVSNKTDAVINVDCKNESDFSKFENFQTLQQPSPEQRVLRVNENVLLSNETEFDLESHNLSSNKEVDNPVTEVESGVSEEQLNAIQSLISLHNQY